MLAALHTTLIFIHAVCGVVAFVFGLISLPARSVTLAFRLYLGALWLMALSLIAVVVVDWGRLDLVNHCVYGALTLLALYTCRRSWRALRSLQRRTAGQRDAYIDDLGFTLIVLFVGFVAIAALDLGSPTWLVLVIGALCVFIGRFGVRRINEREVAAAGAALPKDEPGDHTPHRRVAR